MSTSISTSFPQLWWDSKKCIDHTCAVCHFMFRDKEDFDSNRKFGACTECVDTYYYPNAEAWDGGWRPQLERKDDIQ